MWTDCAAFFRAAVLSSICVASIGVTSSTWAVNPTTPVTSATATPAPATPANNTTTNATANNAAAPLRQANTPITDIPPTMAALQQKHKAELAQQQQRLALLEQANQTALAHNQELQLKNDNLTVQVQVLQSERSAQMFIYGAVTFAGGTLAGIIIYSILYTRRRRQW